LAQLNGVTPSVETNGCWHTSTSLEPNQPEALRGLVQFCLERRRVDEALDFALHNGRSVLSDAVDSAKLMAENLALDAIRREMPEENVISDRTRSGMIY
jgi:hypothetical protein